MRFAFIHGFLILAASCLFAGCAETAAPEADASAAATTPAAPQETPAPAAPASEPPKAEAAKTPTAPENTAAAAPGSNATAAAAPPVEPFQPPYPQRDNMFRRPNTDNNKSARAETNNSIELKGFVNMDGLRAVLVIDGKTVTLKQGEQRGEIEVIEVTPPKVILQRGRARWTTQLFEPATNRTAALSN